MHSRIVLSDNVKLPNVNSTALGSKHNQEKHWQLSEKTVVWKCNFILLRESCTKRSHLVRSEPVRQSFWILCRHLGGWQGRSETCWWSFGKPNRRQQPWLVHNHRALYIARLSACHWHWLVRRSGTASCCRSGSLGGIVTCLRCSSSLCRPPPFVQTLPFV